MALEDSCYPGEWYPVTEIVWSGLHVGRSIIDTPEPSKFVQRFENKWVHDAVEKIKHRIAESQQ